MVSLLLAIIYLSFISLGLPDALLGSAWPIIQKDFSVPVSYAGIISLIICLGTIVSSLNSDRLTKKFNTHIITTFSVFLTAIALFGFSISNSFILLCFFAIPYGLGAGAVDAALNNYVAINFSSKHMNWLHCFWGVGATISPYLMSFALLKDWGWSAGYSIVATIQIALTFILFLSMPIWNINNKTDVIDETVTNKEPHSFEYIFSIRGVKYILLAFFCYCALESVTGLWTCTYLVEVKNIDHKLAAMFTSLFYIGITIGRFLCGFIADKLGDKKLIRFGNIIILFGIILIILPTSINVFSLAGLIIIGLGCAPIYPSIIHSTPDNFGKENSQAIIGVQMASAYLGSALMPPLFGITGQFISLGLYPYFLLILLAILFFNIERLWITLKTH